MALTLAKLKKLVSDNEHRHDPRDVQLMRYVMDGDINGVIDLIGQGANLNAIVGGAEGYTPLMAAAVTRNLNMVETLLMGGANVFQNGGRGHSSPIAVAIELVDLPIIKRLVTAINEKQDGYNTINNKCEVDGRNAFICAVRTGSAKVVNLLLEISKPDIEERDFRGNNALMHAVLRNDIDMVKLLKKIGCNLNSTENKEGYIPLMMALKLGNYEIVELVATPKNINQTFYHDYENNLANCSTPLLMAISKGETETIDKLISLGASLKLSVGGLSPLAAAIRVQNWSLANKIMQRGIRLDHYDIKNIMETIISENNEEFFELVIKLGFNPNSIFFARSGQSYLSLAAQSGNMYAVKRLIELGVDLEFKTNKEWLHPMVCASRANPPKIDIMKYFLKAAAGFNIGSIIRESVHNITRMLDRLISQGDAEYVLSRLSIEQLNEIFSFILSANSNIYGKLCEQYMKKFHEIFLSSHKNSPEIEGAIKMALSDIRNFMHKNSYLFTKDHFDAINFENRDPDSFLMCFVYIFKEYFNINESKSFEMAINFVENHSFKFLIASSEAESKSNAEYKFSP